MSIIQSIIGTSFFGDSIDTPTTTFVASSYSQNEGNPIIFTITTNSISDGTTLYWWIDGTSNNTQLADQFTENINSGTVQISGGSATFTLTPVLNSNNITFNIYIGYSLYQGFLNLPSNITIVDNKSDFTIEWWQKTVNSVSNNDRLFEVGAWPEESIGFSEELIASGLFIWTGGSYDNVSQNIPSLYNVWVHFAICRHNGIINLYKNGSSILSRSSNNSILNNNTDLVIGGSLNNVNNYNGYLTNFHIIKGVSKYTEPFTPSINPTIPDAETKLLLNVTDSSNTYTDNSTRSHVATIIGGTYDTDTPLTSGGSIYFDGTSTLIFPASDDWAIDSKK